jgi:hypothetical protein
VIAPWLVAGGGAAAGLDELLLPHAAPPAATATAAAQLIHRSVLIAGSSPARRSVAREAPVREAALA